MASDPRGGVMKGFVQDIEALTVGNDEFRRVLYTAKHCQLVLMALKPKEEIGLEVHQLDQFFRVEEGSGEVTCSPKTGPGRMSLLPPGREKRCVAISTASSRSSGS
jgi:mannose-6-phosphate isomerase-like protein (cupin superfamily)